MTKEVYEERLYQALMKVSDGKLDDGIARQVAATYVAQLDCSDPDLLHKGVTSVAKLLVTKIKSKHFK